MSEWIRVEDRLPSEDAYYLVYWSDNEISTLDWFIHKSNSGWNYSPSEMNNNITVTHWMPLPEPPKNQLV